MLLIMGQNTLSNSSLFIEAIHLKYNTFIFDLDGTIIDSSQTVLNGFNFALAPFNKKVSMNEVEAMRSLASQQLFLDILTESEAQHALSRLWQHSVNSVAETILINNIEDILNKIANNNIKIGLWTGRDRTSALEILKYHQIEQYFQGVVGGCEIALNKPHPQGLLLLAERLDANPDEMLHIGDHEHDLMGANAAGVACAYAKWCYEDSDGQYNALANFTFNSLHDFELWFDQLILHN